MHDNTWTRSADGENMIAGAHAYFDLAIVTPKTHNIEFQYADRALIAIQQANLSPSAASHTFRLTASGWRENIYDITPSIVDFTLTTDAYFTASIRPDDCLT
jgi:hypothetical protein